jgi:BirA family transcriptional regulator, biotin operon repressor / biotin---[acetyl-CoA-carboxylase] ligase
LVDSLALAVVEPRLTGRLGHPFVYLETCDTPRLLEPSLEEGAVTVCEEAAPESGFPVAAWEAPAGTALLCTVVLDQPDDRPLPQLALVGAVALADAAELALGLAAQIKWPNDVMVNRRKVGRAHVQARDGRVALGLVVNVNQTREQLPQNVGIAPASLRTIDGRSHDRAAVLVSLLARLERHYERWRADGIDGVYDDLGSRDFLRGRVVAVDGAWGVAAGIDRQGRLVIDLDGGGRQIVEAGAGTVSYER